MKLNQVLQSVFLGLILVGLFATMAHNSYGFTLIGMSCFGLALLYIVQISWILLEDFSGIEKKDAIDISELLLLAIMILLFGFRAFYIHIPFGDLIFITVCGMLILVYSLITSGIYNTAKNENPALARDVFFFYSSIILFLLSLSIRIINPSLSAVIGAFGILASVPFLFEVFRQKKYDFAGKSTTIFQFVLASRNKAGILFLFFIFSVLYVGLTNFKIIPAIGNADKPKTYIDLINQAETGKEKPVNGKYKHEIYKEYMDKFLKKHGGKKGS